MTEEQKQHPSLNGWLRDQMRRRETATTRWRSAWAWCHQTRRKSPSSSSPGVLLSSLSEQTSYQTSETHRRKRTMTNRYGGWRGRSTPSKKRPDSSSIDQEKR